MLTDSRTIPDGTQIQTDICIIGGGVAGLTLARELARHALDVWVLESGGIEHDDKVQVLSRGEISGLPYDPLDVTRLRRLGGTSHLWKLDLPNGGIGARLLPLDQIDFEARKGVPYSGWPFTKRTLDPYYARAHEVCGLERDTYDPDHWEEPPGRPHLDATLSKLRTTIFQLGDRESFTGDIIRTLSEADKVTTAYYAQVTQVRLDESNARVSEVQVARMDGGEGFSVSATVFVLATGGIENARLLLAWNRTHQDRLGNQHDLVGRFFMEHPKFRPESWLFVTSSDNELKKRIAFYLPHEAKGTPIMGQLGASPELLRREQTLNFCASFHPRSFVPDVVTSLRSLRSGAAVRKGWRMVGYQVKRLLTHLDQLPVVVQRRLRQRLRSSDEAARDRFGAFVLQCVMEQCPNPESRVLLTERKDALGLNLPRLDWRLTELDRVAMDHAYRVVNEEVSRLGLATRRGDEDATIIPESFGFGHHHMGTTRMDPDARQGVVDEHCRVHGVKNLFVAGSSVFPTSGHANPTLTLIALAIRLADHIADTTRDTTARR